MASEFVVLAGGKPIPLSIGFLQNRRAASPPQRSPQLGRGETSAVRDPSTESPGPTLAQDGILQRLQPIFRRYDPQIVLSSPSPLQNPDWDSLRHVQVMMDVEHEFGITFDNSDEWSELATINDLIKAISHKVGPPTSTG